MSLSQDLAKIRTDQQLSLEDLYALSKMPVDILESIENGLIFEDESRNITYKRSFIRSYAKALRIDDTDITKALDQELEGNYTGSILQKYMGRGSATELKNVKIPRQIIVDTTSNTPSVPVQKTEEQIKRTKVAAQTAPKKVEGEINSISLPIESPYNKTQKPPTINSVEWANIGTSPISLNSIPKVVGGVVALIIVIAVVYWVFTYAYSTSNDSKKEITAVETPKSESISDVKSNQNGKVGQPNADSLKTIIPAEISKSTALGDTLSLVIVAVDDKLEPVRVKTDLSSSYFPYWIEKGNGMRFTFKDTIEIKGQYNRMTLLFNNRAIEELKENRGKNKEIIVSRELLKSNPTWLTPTTAETEAKFPTPIVIVDRPVF